MRLSNRVVLVTGGSSGIGLATVLRAAEEGARVVVIDVQPPPPEIDIEGVTCERCDLADAGAVQTAIGRIVEATGPIDVLVNNAGVLGSAPFEDVSRERWNEVMQVNVAAPFFLTQLLATQFRAGSAVINIASTSAFVAGRDQIAYEASKAAVVMLTRSLALALAPRGIRVNAVAPGLVDTPLTRRLFGTAERFDARVREKIPLGRAARPAEIAEAVIFLASEDAAYVTGETLVVDGGWLLE